ncbi:MAG: hypothetical protein ACYCY6_01875, partial [Minisyncoccota bacterium]
HDLGDCLHTDTINEKGEKFFLRISRPVFLLPNDSRSSWGSQIVYHPSIRNGSSLDPSLIRSNTQIPTILGLTHCADRHLPRAHRVTVDVDLYWLTEWQALNSLSIRDSDHQAISSSVVHHSELKTRQEPCVIPLHTVLRNDPEAPSTKQNENKKQKLLHVTLLKGS